MIDQALVQAVEFLGATFQTRDVDWQIMPGRIGQHVGAVLCHDGAIGKDQPCKIGIVAIFRAGPEPGSDFIRHRTEPGYNRHRRAARCCDPQTPALPRQDAKLGFKTLGSSIGKCMCAGVPPQNDDRALVALVGQIGKGLARIFDQVRGKIGWRTDRLNDIRAVCLVMRRCDQKVEVF